METITYVWDESNGYTIHKILQDFNNNESIYTESRQTCINTVY